jgi:hypothetical protein
LFGCVHYLDQRAFSFSTKEAASAQAGSLATPFHRRYNFQSCRSRFLELLASILHGEWVRAKACHAERQTFCNAIWEKC